MEPPLLGALCCRAALLCSTHMLALFACPAPPPLEQVVNKEFEVVTHLARTATVFSKRDALIACEGVVDKIHELKHK